MKTLKKDIEKPLTGQQILQKKITDAEIFVKKVDWVKFREMQK